MSHVRHPLTTSMPPLTLLSRMESVSSFVSIQFIASGGPAPRFHPHPRPLLRVLSSKPNSNSITPQFTHRKRESERYEQGSARLAGNRTHYGRKCDTRLLFATRWVENSLDGRGLVRVQPVGRRICKWEWDASNNELGSVAAHSIEKRAPSSWSGNRLSKFRTKADTSSDSGCLMMAVMVGAAFQLIVKEMDSCRSGAMF